MASSAAILVVNPNTTESMTRGLEETISKLTSTKPNYFTAPTGVPSINNSADCHTSAQAVLPYLLIPPHSQASGYLISCYSDHPLVAQLKQQTTKPVVGIFEASVAAALLLIAPSQRFGIVSTGQVWEDLLDAAVAKFLGTKASNRYAGTETTGLNATDLHDAPAEEVRKRMKAATKQLVRRGQVGAVCLGCAGMVGMEEMVREACIEELGSAEGAKVRIVDGVKAGFVLLEGLVKTLA